MGILKIFNKKDCLIWGISVAIVVVSFFLGGDLQPLQLIISLLGVTSSIFLAKGHYIGNVIMIVFCVLYSYISYKNGYYGELIICACLNFPMTIIGVITWLKNPFKGDNSEVEVGKMRTVDSLMLLVISVVIACIFFYILRFLATSNLIISTVSIGTSFFAAGLLAKRIEFYGLACALNDIVLMTMWTLASFQDMANVTMVVCFGMFLLNDLYGYFNWKKIKEKQMVESAV